MPPIQALLYEAPRSMGLSEKLNVLLKVPQCGSRLTLRYLVFKSACASLLSLSFLRNCYKNMLAGLAGGGETSLPSLRSVS